MGLAKNFGFYSIISIVAIFMLNLQGSNGQEEVLCLGQDLNMTQVQKNVLTDCLRIVGIVSIWKMPMEKVSCFGVCVLEKKGLLNASGGLDHDRIYKYIMEVMKPDKVRQPIVTGVEKCMKDHGIAVRQPNDPNCLTFMEVGQCVHEVFLGECVEG